MYEIMLYLHVIGACILLGTGAGIAFFMVMAHKTHDAAIIAHTAGVVVLADTVFTATAVIAQPLTGTWLAINSGWPLLEGWIFWSLCLYMIVGLFWLPVVWIQFRMYRLALAARDAKTSLPAAYHQLYRVWFAFGFPAFFSVLTIIWLMLTKPGP